MTNWTNSSGQYYGYEYYLDYMEPAPVDERKLVAYKHSIIIAFWVSLVAFVVLLFVILLCMSRSGSPQISSPQRQPSCPWRNLLAFFPSAQRHPRNHWGLPVVPRSAVEKPRRGSDSEQPLQCGDPSASAPALSQALPARGTGPQMGDALAPADIDSEPRSLPIGGPSQRHS